MTCIHDCVSDVASASPRFATNALRACMLLAVVTIVFAPLEHFFAIRPWQPVREGLEGQSRLVFL
jgi:hypothetical protein